VQFTAGNLTFGIPLCYLYCVQYVFFIVFVIVCAVFCLCDVCYFVCCVLL
jgi:hypothetical protein